MCVLLKTLRPLGTAPRVNKHIKEIHIRKKEEEN